MDGTGKVSKIVLKTYEEIDELVDTNPLALRDYAVGLTRFLKDTFGDVGYLSVESPANHSDFNPLDLVDKNKHG